MNSSQNNTLDKILDIAGTAAVAVPCIFTGLPGWAIGICGVVALVTGRAASGRGVPLFSSFAPVKKNPNGSSVDPEDPKP